MKIYDIKKKKNNEYYTLSAMIEWENNNRPPFEIYFKTRSENNVFITDDYNAFLLACISPALHFRESRIFVDGSVCPWLVENLLCTRQKI